MCVSFFFGRRSVTFIRFSKGVMAQENLKIPIQGELKDSLKYTAH